MTQGSSFLATLGLEATIPLGLPERALWPAARPHVVARAKSPVPSAFAKLLRLPESRSASAPTGLRPKAQGCRNAATLGHRSTNPPTATRLRPIRCLRRATAP